MRGAVVVLGAVSVLGVEKVGRSVFVDDVGRRDRATADEGRTN